MKIYNLKGRSIFWGGDSFGVMNPHKLIQVEGV